MEGGIGGNSRTLDAPGGRRITGVSALTLTTPATRAFTAPAEAVGVIQACLPYTC